MLFSYFFVRQFLRQQVTVGGENSYCLSCRFQIRFNFAMAVFANTVRKHRQLYRCALFLYFLTFLVILPLVCRDMKFSFYWGIIWPRNMTEDTIKLRQENEQRFLMAQQYLKSTKFEKFSPPKNGSDIKLRHTTPIILHRRLANWQNNSL